MDMWLAGWRDAWIGEWMDGCMARWMDGYMDGWDRYKYINIQCMEFTGKTEWEWRSSEQSLPTFCVRACMFLLSFFLSPKTAIPFNVHLLVHIIGH